MKKIWLNLFEIGPPLGGRPISGKNIGGPLSIEYVADEALWGNSSGIVPIQVTLVPGTGLPQN